MKPYPIRLATRIAERGQFCVGIDPHPATLQRWGLPTTAAGLETCALTVVEALGEQVAVFKPQSAFFEVYGSAGVAVLERVLAEIRAAGALSLLDIKRGDIGSTMNAYATAYLSEESTLRADAITLSPYLGVGALDPAIELAASTGRGLYLLARTSNPDGGRLQGAIVNSQQPTTVAQEVVNQAAAANARCGQDLVGLVVGATHGRVPLDLGGFTGSILMPGIGAQGAQIADLAKILPDAVTQALPTSSRDIVDRGPDPVALRSAVAATVTEMDHLTGRLAS